MLVNKTTLRGYLVVGDDLTVMLNGEVLGKCDNVYSQDNGAMGFRAYVEVAGRQFGITSVESSAIRKAMAIQEGL